jgi:hypothetical protein
MLVKTRQKRRKGKAKSKGKVQKIGIISVDRFTEIATFLKGFGVELTAEANEILETLGQLGSKAPKNKQPTRVIIHGYANN